MKIFSASFIDRLKRAGIDDNQVWATDEAMNEALRESVATKSDIERLEARITRMWIAIVLLAALVLIKSCS